MHSKHFNEFRLKFKLKLPPKERLLIAQVREEGEGEGNAQTNDSDEKKLPPLISVRDNGHLYIPGSSFKGALRNRAEYIARIIHPHHIGTCHLFSPSFLQEPIPTEDEALYQYMACSDRFKIRMDIAKANGEELDHTHYHKDACPICRLFGHSFWAGHLRVTDFLMTQENVVTRPHNAIDRITGGVASRDGKGQLFSAEYATNSIFEGEVVIKNYEFWQLGLLGFLFQDINEGLLLLGNKKTSGNGQLEVRYECAEIRLIRSKNNPDKNRLVDVSHFLGKEHKYGYSLTKQSVKINGITWHNTHPLWWEATVKTPNAIQAIFNATRDSARAQFRDFSYHSSMEISTLNHKLTQTMPEPKS